MTAAESGGKVQLNEFGRQWRTLAAPALEALGRVGASGRYILGPEVAAFEGELAQRWGLRHAVGVGSGLDALEIALRCAGVRAGDRVLTTPLSAFATTLAALRLGAKPVFVDVDERGLLDLELCADVLARRPDIRAILPVHLYGHPLDLDALDELRRRYGLAVVEDCAQSLGAAWRERPTGSASAICATSFYPTKNLGALGDGGAVLTDQEALAAQARELRHYGQSALYRHDRLGLNSRLDELQAALMRSALLPRLDGFLAGRRAVAERYCAEIRHPGLRLPRRHPRSRDAWHLFALRVPPGRRQAFVDHLAARGVESGQHYPRLIPDQQAMREADFEVVGELGRARDFAEQEVSLPVHPQLRADEVDRVIAACNAWSD